MTESKGNNSKNIKQELWFLRSAHRLMLIDIYMKFGEDSLNYFQVIERTRFCDRVQGKYLKKYKCKLWFLPPAHPREITQKSINARVMVLALCTSSNVDWYLYEVS